MAVIPVLFHPDAILRQKSKPVETVTPDILRLLDDMADTMYDAEGIGLAAPQVGELVRVIVADVEPRDEEFTPKPIKLINPEIIASGATKTMLDEGCLSLPKMRIDVERPENVTVRYMNIDGETVEIEADGLLAKCLQHEIDHLNGVLIFDHATPLKRNIALRRYQKMLRFSGDE